MIVLDTHAWIWRHAAPTKLGRKAARAIEKADRIGLPAICVWEMAMKVEARKLKLDRPMEAWLDDALAEDSRVELLPLSPHVAIDACRLSWGHGDPADRFIVAIARAYDAPLVTADERIHGSGLVRCVWD